MANVLFGTPVFNDVGVLYTPTYSGGSWETANPLTNLSDRRMHRIARSDDALAASTQFVCDLKAARPVRAVMVPKHNLSSAGTYRVRGFVSVPVLDSRTVGDAAWTTASGTPTRTAAAYTAPDGVPMDLIEDNDAASNEGYFIAAPFTTDGTKAYAIRIKQGTATATHFGVYDFTAGVWRARFNAAWSGGVPTVTVASGSGAVLSTTLIGDGVYRVVMTGDAIVAANVNRFYVYGANFTAATTGTTYYADAMAWDADTDQLAYDSGFLSAWASGETAETRAPLNRPLLAIVPTTATDSRYWKFEVVDTTNPDGYIDLHRLCITGGFQPSANFQPGAALALESDTTTVYTESGSGIHDSRPLRRTFRCVTALLGEDEAIVTGFRTLAQAGARQQVVVVPDPDATRNILHDSAFVGVARDLTALEYAVTTYRTIGLSFTEEL